MESLSWQPYSRSHRSAWLIADWISRQSPRRRVASSCWASRGCSLHASERLAWWDNCSIFKWMSAKQPRIFRVIQFWADDKFGSSCEDIIASQKTARNHQHFGKNWFLQVTNTNLFQLLTLSAIFACAFSQYWTEKAPVVLGMVFSVLWVMMFRTFWFATRSWRCTGYWWRLQSIPSSFALNSHLTHNRKSPMNVKVWRIYKINNFQIRNGDGRSSCRHLRVGYAHDEPG